jgi:4-hydroxyphenylacetate 3-hydroxylase N terminal
MRTKQDYIKGLSKMKRNIYYDGQLIDRTDELQMRCLNTIGTTYEEAEKPENSDLMTAISHLTGERINRFTHIHQNKEDLHKKQDMTRMLCQKVGGCIQRCMGIDAINAIRKINCSNTPSAIPRCLRKIKRNSGAFWEMPFALLPAASATSEPTMAADRPLWSRLPLPHNMISNPAKNW